MSSDSPTCDRYYTNGNQTHILFQYFEGIPTNLIINVVAWVVLFTLFSVLRKRAWNYGRIALLSGRAESSRDPDDSSRYNVWTTLFYSEQPPSESDGSAPGSRKESFTYMPSFFRLRDSDIRQQAGPDAIIYLTFQRYLLVFACFMTVLAIAVILPINMQGTLKSATAQQFGATTISNISANAPNFYYLWAHFLLAVVLVVLAVLCMRRFSSQLHCANLEPARRTLMISGIAPEHNTKSNLQQHFREAYPEHRISDVQVARDIDRLIILKEAMDEAGAALRRSRSLYESTNKRPTMVPVRCGRLCCCCGACGCAPVDAIEFYERELAKITDQVEVERSRALTTSLSIAFVTFESIEDATKVLQDSRSRCCHLCRKSELPLSTVSTELHTVHWDVTYAPPPDTIHWGNLSFKAWHWWLKATIVNTVVLLFAFFFTTPTYVLNLLDDWNFRDHLTAAHVSPVVVQFAPSLILWTVSALLPFVVAQSDQLVGHWTKTAEQYTVMVKTFTYLILMVLILPSLGLTSIPAVLDWLFPTPDRNGTLVTWNLYSRAGAGSSVVSSVQWECIFLPDNGAFFVNYVITSAFIGTGLELIRFPELLVYAIRMLMSRSDAERSAVRKKVLWEFQFGQSYAWMLCVFAVIASYSLVVPLIMPFGLAYLVLKHLVDRYNLYFAYTPSRTDKQLHVTAVRMMVAGVIFLEANVTLYIAMRLKVLEPLTALAIVTFIVAVLLCLLQSFIGAWIDMGPVKYVHVTAGGEASPTEPDGNQLETEWEFVPRVIQQDPVAPDNQATAATIPDYGTAGQTLQGVPSQGGNEAY